MELSESRTAGGGPGFWRCTGRRELRTSERRALRRRSLGLRARSWLVGLSLPVAFLAFLMVMAAFDEGQTPGILFKTGTLTGLAALALLFFAARHLRRESRAFDRDAYQPYVYRYAGEAPAGGDEGDWPAPRLRPLLQAGLLSLGTGEEQWIEVLPSTGLVWTANGVRAQGWFPAWPVSEEWRWESEILPLGVEAARARLEPLLADPARFRVVRAAGPILTDLAPELREFLATFESVEDPGGYRSESGIVRVSRRDVEPLSPDFQYIVIGVARSPCTFEEAILAARTGEETIYVLDDLDVDEAPAGADYPSIHHFLLHADLQLSRQESRRFP